MEPAYPEPWRPGSGPGWACCANVLRPIRLLCPPNIYLQGESRFGALSLSCLFSPSVPNRRALTLFFSALLAEFIYTTFFFYPLLPGPIALTAISLLASSFFDLYIQLYIISTPCKSGFILTDSQDSSLV
ncbi:hypothetical protein GGR52DRAFT_201802 [Hypoxylon sp. FL1284]|nr:hypothetical protein GGR52DRAFT_201802 [Hypoxylon sp. FL1284]